LTEKEEKLSTINYQLSIRMMDYQLIIWFISIGICMVYLMAVMAMFGVPESVSDSFYLLNRRRRGLGYLFTAWCWAVAGTVMPLVFVLSDGQWYQFLGLFAGGGLGFVGAAPLFKGSERTIHYVSTGVCATAAVAWMVCAGYWYIPAAWVLPYVLISVLWRKLPLFWIETFLFLSMYATLLARLSAQGN
jgi:hypothetical protein